MQAAQQQHQAGRLPEAEAGYRQILRREPDHADALHYLGVLSAQLGKHAIAIEFMRKAVRIDPANPVYFNNLATALKEQGNLGDAAINYQKAIAANPTIPDYYNNLGLVLKDEGKLDEAVVNYRKAIDASPPNPIYYNNLGLALKEQGNLEGAATAYRNALAIEPEFSGALNNLGIALKEQGRLNDAVASYLKALSIKPDYAEAHNNLGNVLKEQGRLDEAVASYLKALSIKPAYADAHFGLAIALQDQGKLDEAVASYRQALSCKPDFAAVYSNLLFATQFCAVQSPEELLAIHAPFAAQFEAPLKAQWRRHQNTAEPARRLKVGYVSPDLRRHAVAFFIEPVLACHDSKQIEVFCYYNHLLRDGFTDRLAGYADHWLDCKSLPDPQLAERIRADGIDILVDLAGHTRDNRLLTFARKPAPIQITYLGYPGTSGLTAMDYRLTDGCADPAGSEAYYTEKLLRLPDSLCCYRPDRDMPQITALPARHNGYVTFGSFNNFNKIDRPCIELWARVLSAVPGSRLLMVTVPEGESRQRLTAQFGALGVAAQRLEFVGKLAQGEFLRTFQRADIALDPIAVTGGTTTCEALWMGLPVVVLVGARFTTRVGYSFLSAAGLQEFAAQSAQGYVQVAAKLAGDLTRLAQLRAGMRAQMARSPLVDEARFTRNLEKIYRQVWQHWCSAAT